jgi:hypothetical protein
MQKKTAKKTGVGRTKTATHRTTLLSKTQPKKPIKSRTKSQTKSKTKTSSKKRETTPATPWEAIKKTYQKMAQGRWVRRSASRK